VNSNTSGTRARVQTVSSCYNGELREAFTYVSATSGTLRLADYDASSSFR
jgi:hypothetical protein